MPSYKVEYTTDQKPTGLPVGAKVEKVSSLPVTVSTGLNRKITVTGGGLSVERTGEAGMSRREREIVSALDPADQRKLGNALLEAAGYVIPDSPDVTVTSIYHKTIEVKDHGGGEVEVNVRSDAGSLKTNLILAKDQRKKLGRALLAD